MGKIKTRECQNVEFKSSWNDKYLEWICGFANAQGAVMYFGVNDNHEVIGLKQTKKLLEDIPNKIVNAMGLVVDVNLHEQDGLEYIEVVIDPASVPISYKGKYYYRSGSTMQELTGTALTDFIMRKLNVTWDAATEPSAKIEDIDPEAIKFFLNAAIREGRISESARNDSIEQLLRKLHLINEDNGYITIAALLLFGKDVERWNMTVATIKREKFMAIQKGQNVTSHVTSPASSLSVVQLTERQKSIVSRLFETGQKIVLDDVLKDALENVLKDVQKDVLENALEKCHRDG